MSMPVSDQEIAAALERLPPVSSVIRRLLAVLDDPNSDIDDISRLIRVDIALSAEVLRLANSAKFGHAGRIASIEEAIQQTGVVEVARVATTVSARQLSMRPLGSYRISHTLLWKHTLAVAVGAEMLAERFLAESAAAYLAGLLHAIGLIVMDQVAIARGVPAIALGASLVDWEQRHFGCSNADVSVRVLKGWGFPEAVVIGVATRCTRPKPNTIGALGGILYLASALAERVPAGLPPEAGLFEVPDSLLQSLRMDRDEFSGLELKVGQQISRLSTLL